MNEPRSGNGVRVGSSRQPGGEGLSLLHIVDITRRRWLWAFVPLVLCTAASVAIAYKLPPTYTSEVVVAAESLAHTDSAARPAVVDVPRHLATIRETIYRRSLLEQVSDEFGLYERQGEGVREGSLESLRSTIDIGVVGAETFKISYTSGEPQLAKNVAARLAELFIADVVQSRRAQADRVTDILDRQIYTLARQLDEEERLLEEYKQRSGGDLPLAIQAQLTELERLRDNLERNDDDIRVYEAERAQVVAELTLLENIRGVDPDVAAAKLREELAELRSRYTDNHPDVISKQRQLVAYEGAATSGESVNEGGEYASEPQLRYIQLVARSAAVERTLADIESDSRGITGRIRAAESQMAAIPAQQTELARLQRSYDTAKTQHATLLRRRYDTNLADELAQSNIGLTFRLLEPARLPLDPSGPPRLRLALLGLGVGLCLAATAVFLAEWTDGSFPDVEEFREFTDMPILASIPSIGRSGTNRTGSKLVTLIDPSAVATEQYRLLAMKARQSLDAEGNKVLLVTSAAGGEGKTTTSINLAVALSEQTAGRVLLLDCDLRWPRVRELLHGALKNQFGGRGKGGFAELLESPQENPFRFVSTIGTVTLGSALPDGERRMIRAALNHCDGDGEKAADILGIGVEKVYNRIEECILYVIAGGAATSESIPALVSSAGYRTFLALRERFDYIVLDAPPIVPVADSHMLARLADQVLLVVRAGRTPRDLVERAARSFDLTKVRGVVLNDVNYRRSHHASAYDYYSGAPRRKSA